MTVAKDALRLAKKLTRKERNKAGKLAKATAREAATKIPHIDVPKEPRSIPALSWQNAKSGYKQSGFITKHRPGNKELHDAAEAENHARSLTAYQRGPANDPLGLTGLATEEEVYEAAVAMGTALPEVTL